MIVETLEPEVELYVSTVRHLRDEQGRVGMMCNGKSHREGTVNLRPHPVKLRAPLKVLLRPAAAGFSATTMAQWCEIVAPGIVGRDEVWTTPSLKTKTTCTSALMASAPTCAFRKAT